MEKESFLTLAQGCPNLPILQFFCAFTVILHHPYFQHPNGTKIQCSYVLLFMLESRADGELADRLPNDKALSGQVYF